MNTARLDDVIQAVGPDFHGLSYRERLIVGAVLKRLSTPPADDSAWYTDNDGRAYGLGRPSAPPADDVREALARTMRPDLDWDCVCDSEDRDVQIAHSIPRDNARKAAERVLAAFEVRPRGTVTDAVRPVELYYCPEHGDLLPRGSAETRSLRCAEAHSVEQIRSSLSPRGTVADTEVEYGCRSGSHSGFMRSVLHWSDESTWRDHLAGCPSPAPVTRRAAGSWEARS